MHGDLALLTFIHGAVEGEEHILDVFLERPELPKLDIQIEGTEIREGKHSRPGACEIRTLRIIRIHRLLIWVDKW